MKETWFLKMLENIRSAVAADAEIIAAAATVLAAFVIVVKMVRFHYRLSSDEQGGGLSDVSAKDFIWPLFLLFLLSNSPAIGNGINSIVSDCMTALSENAEAYHFKSRYLVSLNNELSAQEEIKGQLDNGKNKSDNSFSQKYSGYQLIQKAIDTRIEQLNEKIKDVSSSSAKDSYAKYGDELGSVDYESQQWEALMNVVPDAEWSFSTFFQAVEHKLWYWLMSILMWFYDMIVLIRLFMGTVFMSVMLYFFPLVFLAMLFDRYKGAFGSFMVAYVELALWQPMTSIILYCSSCAITQVTMGGMGPTWCLMIVIATIMAASEVGTYAKYAMTAFNGSGGNASGKSGLGQLKGMIK